MFLPLLDSHPFLVSGDTKGTTEEPRTRKYFKVKLRENGQTVSEGRPPWWGAVKVNATDKQDVLVCPDSDGAWVWVLSHAKRFISLFKPAHVKANLMPGNPIWDFQWKYSPLAILGPPENRTNKSCEMAKILTFSGNTPTLEHAFFSHFLSFSCRK